MDAAGEQPRRSGRRPAPPDRGGTGERPTGRRPAQASGRQQRAAGRPRQAEDATRRDDGTRAGRAGGGRRPARTGGQRAPRAGGGRGPEGGGSRRTGERDRHDGGSRGAGGQDRRRGDRARRGSERPPRQRTATRDSRPGRREPPPPSAPDEELPEVGEVLAPETLDELRETARPHAFGEAARALAEAVVALSEEDDPEVAARAARAAKRAAPRAASVREALGVALYQVGDFRAARTELAAAQRISGRVDLTALLADIERALGRPERAVALFERTDRSRMGPDTAAELLLVAASAYGDLGQPAAGVALIRRYARWPVELVDHHLRLAYAEGALAEQAGDLARARAAFERVVRAEPDFHDAAERLERLAAG